MKKNIVSDPRTKLITEDFEINISKKFEGSGINIKRTEPKHSQQLAFEVSFNNMFVKGDKWSATPMLITIIHDEVDKAYKGLDLQVTWNDKKTKFFIASK